LENAEPRDEKPKDHSASLSSLVDSIEKTIATQKTSSFQHRAQIDTAISSLIPFILNCYRILFKGLNAMAKITVDAEMKREKIRKRQEIEDVYARFALESSRLHQRIKNDAIKS